MSSLKRWVCGIDLGVKSVGVALLDTQGKRILHTAVRVFPAGVSKDEQFQNGGDEPKNKQRREARLARRQTLRRVRRKKNVFHLLQRNGLLPDGEVFEALENLDQELAKKYPTHPGVPYTLRARALDHGLDRYELGRAFYHLAQRRGFLSNRRAPLKDDEEKGKVGASIDELETRMRETGARTLGEYFAKLDVGHNVEAGRIRGRYTHRKMFELEFEAIWAAQAMHHPSILTEDFKSALASALFHQRPLKDQSHLIGSCSLIRGAKRAPVYALAAQRWRLLDRVNNLRLTNPQRPLDADERKTLINALTVAESLTYSHIRKKLLKLPNSVRFSIEAGEEKKMPGNVTYARFADALNLKWDKMSSPDQQHLVELWAEAKDDEAFRTALESSGAYSEEEIQRLLGVRLPDGYLGFSLLAIQRLLPHMEEGKTTAEARHAEFPESFAAVEPKDSLPPVLEMLPELRNPAVIRTLTELRKVMNELIRRYGKPDEIRVELARDLKRNKKDRQALTKQMRSNEKKRNSAREALKTHGLFSPSRADLEKYVLWEECGHICPYTGRAISLKSLFDEPLFEVEHIIPYSSSLDDSFQNKLLCARDHNKLKGKRTPWEAFGATDEWEHMLARVKQMGNRAKLRRFELTETDTATLLEKFSSAELNDTRYMSKLAGKYLGALYGGTSDQHGKQRIFVCAGGVTALLRRLWDLNTILNAIPVKSREDHRHHAVDAIAVSMVTQRMVQLLADASKRVELGGQRRLKSFEEPWLGFRQQVEDQILQRTHVSHRPERKLSGALHEETYYGRPQQIGGKHWVHIRKPVHSLSTKDVNNIVDPTVRAQVELQLNLLGGDSKRLEVEPPTLETRDGRRIPIRKVRVRVAARTVSIGTGRRQRQVMTGDNHHMAVFQVLETNGKPKFKGEVVSRLEAVGRHREGRSVVGKERSGAEFLFSLSEGDMVRWKDELWRVRGVTSTAGGRLTLSRATDARLKKEISAGGDLISPVINVFCQSGGRKVTVSPLGRVQEAHD